MGTNGQVYGDKLKGISEEKAADAAKAAQYAARRKAEQESKDNMSAEDKARAEEIRERIRREREAYYDSIGQEYYVTHNGIN